MKRQYLTTAEGVAEKVRELNLVGRVVEDIRAVGCGFNWTVRDVADHIHDTLDRLPERTDAMKDMEWHFPVEDRFDAEAIIDDPILIKFQDGDVLAIEFVCEGCLYMELNTVSWDTVNKPDNRTFHANRLFADMLGKQIVDVITTVTMQKPISADANWCGMGEQLSYIESVTLRNQDPDEYKGLIFMGDIDYGIVGLLQNRAKYARLTASEAEKVVEGFVTMEDLCMELSDWPRFMDEQWLEYRKKAYEDD